MLARGYYHVPLYRSIFETRLGFLRPSRVLHAPSLTMHIDVYSSCKLAPKHNTKLKTCHGALISLKSLYHCVLVVGARDVILIFDNLTAGLHLPPGT